MRSVIKTYQALSGQDKVTFKALQEEESVRLKRPVTTAELMDAVTPANAWVDTEAQAA